MSTQLPEGWTQSTLGPFLLSKPTYGVVQPGEIQQEGTPMIRVQDLKDGSTLNSDQVARISPEVSKKHRKSVLSGDELLLSVVGSPGKLFKVKEEYRGWNVARALAVLRPASANRNFLFYVLQGPTTQAAIHDYLNTTVQATLNLKDVEVLPITLPPLWEQEAIAEVLGSLDDKIEANLKLATNCVQLLHAMVSGSYPMLPLQEVASLQRDSVKVTELDAMPFDLYSLPGFDNNETAETTEPGAVKSNKTRIKQDSVLVSKLNPRIPRVWLAAAVADRPSVASTEFMVLEPTDEESEVLFAILSSEQFTRQLNELVSGTSGSHQRVRPQDALQILVPSPKEISRVFPVLPSLVTHRNQVLKENRVLAELRDTLLGPLVSGRLRVKDAEKMVGDVL